MNGAEFGFMPDDVEGATRIFQSMNLDEAGYLQTSFDLSRFCMIPLYDASMTVAMASTGRYALLRRLGFRFDALMPAEDALAFVRIEVEGQAESYAKTFHGRVQVSVAERMQEAIG